MEIPQIILILLQIMPVFPKKYVSSSDESIENLLYYKDCQKNTPPEATTRADNRMVNSPQPRGMDCPYPKMCCALTCGGNECGTQPQPFYDDNIEQMTKRMHHPGMGQNFSPIQPMGSMQPVQPQALQRGRKKVKQPMRMQMQPPIGGGGRRDFGFTKDRIKSLINQDDDIRKILKDLVRVTMQKVDLVDMMKTNRAAVSKTPPVQHAFPNTNTHSDDEEDDDDLE